MRIHPIAAGMVGLSLIGAGCVAAPSASAPSASGNANAAAPQAASGRKYQTCEQRHAADGEIWGTDEQGWRPGDRLALPADFPSHPQIDLCGAIGKLQNVYFVSTLSAEAVASFYAEALAAQGYTVSRTGGFGQDLVVDFRRDGVTGNVYVDAKEAIHSVRYRVRT